MRGDRLQQARLRSGHTQESLAEILNTNKGAVSRWEGGKFTPNAETLAKIAMVLETTTDYLLGLTDDPTPHIRIDNLSDFERRLLAAVRRGDKIAAVDLIVSPEKA